MLEPEQSDEAEIDECGDRGIEAKLAALIDRGQRLSRR
jgi:hypothetical protein